MNGMGTTLHHTSAVWLIVGITTGLFTPRTREILAVSLPLVGQVLCSPRPVNNPRNIAFACDLTFA